MAILLCSWRSTSSISLTISQTAFVRHTPLPEAEPPSAQTGAVKWLRENLFNSWVNAALTLVTLYVIVQFVLAALPWFANATWQASSLQECRQTGTGACFAVINERWRQLLFGFYPQSEYWRPTLTFVWMVVAVAPVLFPSLPRRLFWATALFPVVAYWLIWGGSIWPLGPVPRRARRSRSSS
jgi:general L-amino acid transport system permease protein